METNVGLTFGLIQQGTSYVLNNGYSVSLTQNYGGFNPVELQLCYCFPEHLKLWLREHKRLV